jgi:hypothetical protein
MRPNEIYEEFCRLIRCAEGEVDDVLSDVASMDRWPQGHEQYCHMDKAALQRRLAWIKEDLEAADSFFWEHAVEDAMVDLGYCYSTTNLEKGRVPSLLGKVERAEEGIAPLSDEEARKCVINAFK